MQLTIQDGEIWLQDAHQPVQIFIENLLGDLQQ
jgi:hypothetical protein